MTHPTRLLAAQRLQSRLEIPTRIVLDPDPDGAPSTVRTARLAWRPWLPGGTHHLVIQDDVELALAFEHQLLAAIESQPSSPLAFFTEWGSYTASAVRTGILGNAPWVECIDNYVPTVCTALPTSLAEDLAGFLSVCPGNIDDVAFFDFITSRRLQVLVATAGLVEHDGGESIAGNAHFGLRRATTFLGAIAVPNGWWMRPAWSPITGLPAFHRYFDEPVVLDRVGCQAGEGLSRPVMEWPAAEALARNIEEACADMRLFDSPPFATVERLRTRFSGLMLQTALAARQGRTLSSPTTWHELAEIATGRAAAGVLRNDCPDVRPLLTPAVTNALRAAQRIGLRFDADSSL